jgi:serine/threonine-protein kinase
MDQSQRKLDGERQVGNEDHPPLSLEDIEKIDRQTSAALTDDEGGLTGRVIAQYLVGERLGGGAMAAVYRAQDQNIDRSVAIKVLLPGADPTMQERFRREADLVKDLVHPNIVRTLQVGRSRGISYIAMELVEGTSLGELLERKGNFSVADCCHLLAPIADALGYAHAKGIVHRDVKPSNILLKRANPGSPGSVVIANLPYPVIPLLSDFGIARAADAPELTNAGRTIGTPAFMAPEQCVGSAEIDGRADIYALGAVLYRCLVGKPPYAGSTTQILHAHVYDPLLIPDEVAASLPVALERILKHSMAKEPPQRYPTIELMATEMRAAANSPLPPPARPAEEIDPTMTMASLPVAQSRSGGTSRVLVPAPAPTPRPTPAKPAPRTPFGGNGSLRPIATAEPRPAKKRKRSQRNGWGIMALGIAFIVLVGISAMILVNAMLPSLSNQGGDPTVVAEAPNDQATVPQGSVASPAGAILTPEGMQSSTPVVASTDMSKATPKPNDTPAAGTPTVEPTLAVDPDQAWAWAQDAYDNAEWKDAVLWLKAVARLLKDPKHPAIAIDKNQVNEMLVASYVGLAIDNFTQGKIEDALKSLDEALKISPKDRHLTSTRDAIERYAKLADSKAGDVEEQRTGIRRQLADSFATYATDLETAGKACDAEVQIGYAISISVSQELTDRQTQLSNECSAQKANDAIIEVGGSILYSSQKDGTNEKDIWRLPITLQNLGTQQSIFVIPNGAQPQLSPDGSTLAYYKSTGGGAGVWARRVGGGISPYGDPIQYSANAEDGHDAPVSWNSISTQIIYSTQFKVGAAHMYINSTDADKTAQTLADGKDPAWNPRSNEYVFNGYLNGQSPGLILRVINSNFVQQITSNGNDQRPTWTPDGQSIVYMGKDHAGDGGADYEVYRYDLQTGASVRLTDGNPAQDGLPTVSPDGKWVAFMSDRETGTGGKRWRLWYVGIDGGPVRFLSDIAGQPIAWLEHAIQWVR